MIFHNYCTVASFYSFFSCFACTFSIISDGYRSSQVEVFWERYDVSVESLLLTNFKTNRFVVEYMFDLKWVRYAWRMS